MIEERVQNKNGRREPNETEIRVCVETEITDEERLIIDEMKAFMINYETEENQVFKKIDQRKMRDATKTVNVVIRHIETDNVTQTNKLATAAVLWVSEEVGVKKG